MKKEKIKLTRVFHQKGDGRVCDFLTNINLEDVIKRNSWLQESDRKIIKTKTEYHYINDNPNLKEEFKNGILTGEFIGEKPDLYEDERSWNEFYQKSTGNPLPKGGLFK